MRILYFAWVREMVGTGEERIDPPPDARTVADLIGWLEGLSEGHAAALADRSRLRAALDQRFVGPDAELAGAQELAIFPPVTGG